MGFGWMCVSVMQRDWEPTVGNGRGCLVGDTKPLLCYQLGVKSPLCGPYKGSQRQGAGGWGGIAATQLWAGPTHPGSIWALLTSVAAWPLLPPGPGTMEALGRPPLLQSFSEFLFSLNLKYFIGPPSLTPFLLPPYWAAPPGPLLLTPLHFSNALKTTKDFF